MLAKNIRFELNNLVIFSDSGEIDKFINYFLSQI